MAGAESFLDPEWYRVAALKPRLRAHVRLHRHTYRGQTWHVAQDAVTGRFHRFSMAAWHVIGLMDGRRTLDQIWTAAAEQLGDDAPTQREIIRLLHQLHVAELLRTDVSADVEELASRGQRQRRRRLVQQLRTPLAIRIPLVDPERFLNATRPVGRALFSRAGAVLWLGLLSAAALVAAGHWGALTENLTERLLTPQNLALIWLVFPFVKVLHELGHAWAIKRWDGEVHELGIMLLVFTPVPYVDATQSTALRSRGQRALVGLAGMLVEFAIAAVALIVWSQAEPGVVRTVCYNVVIIAGVSTLLFNGNPLLRFDAYYVLSDLIEIPNLADRANRYVYYLVQRYGFGVEDADSPAQVPSERPWLLLYAIASFLFRMLLYFTIVVFVASHYFLIGVLLALWSLFSLFVLPLWRGLEFLLTSPRLARRRSRAVAVTAGAVAGLAGLLLAWPLPHATLAEGVVWVPEDAIVRPEAPGVARAAHAGDTDTVAHGEVIVSLADPLLPAEVAVLAAEVRALEARYDFVEFSDQTQANIVREQLASAREVLRRAEERYAALTVRAPLAGRLVYRDGVPPVGAWLERGSNVGYVLSDAPVRVKVAVDQDAIDTIRSRTEAVAVRLVHELERVIEARILRVVPAGSTELPSPALGTAGGGPIPVDPRDEGRTRTLEPVFELELALPPGERVEAVGSRVHVRFDHGYEPIAWRWYRDLRRLFMRQFEV